MAASKTVTSTADDVAPAYERLLRADVGLSLDEMGRFFAGESKVDEALRRVTARLDRLGIPYAVVGAMAMNAHGFRRVTSDVDILVTPSGLDALHAALRGRGYLPPFDASRHLRDTELGVRIEFLVSGQYPGDGKPKDVAFPDPADTSVVIRGIRYLNLEKLIELKLASGLSAAHRGRDLSDVEDLINALGPPLSLQDRLAPSVREEYARRWQALRRPFYFLVPIAGAVATFEELLSRPNLDAARLAAMRDDGVWLDLEHSTADTAWLTTDDPAVAGRYDMEEPGDLMEGAPSA
jgi:hypothetical protein